MSGLIDARMSRKRIAAIVAALIFLAALLYVYTDHRTPEGQPKLAELTADNFGTIGDAFNAAKEDVRVLVLLSPT